MHRVLWALYIFSLLVFSDVALGQIQTLPQNETLPNPIRRAIYSDIISQIRDISNINMVVTWVESSITGDNRQRVGSACGRLFQNHGSKNEKSSFFFALWAQNVADGSVFFVAPVLTERPANKQCGE